MVRTSACLKWFRARWQSFSRWLALLPKRLWAGLEWALGDDTHWKVLRRLMAVALTILLACAVRYGWMANAKLDWLVKLFSPIFNAELPRGIVP